ncbi:Hypothetical protein, putative [Bodo saltans]|uniref:Uncharacterized protein n=1 Tax=Bodo saltans TaxID=75058 RepID=A0A0S4INB2_BODSA|nr:Hypothetical protein, putative [Bodo saltans]|eukprot:CUE58831.1 Hypothetical protein, putative [Bodo saltans]
MPLTTAATASAAPEVYAVVTQCLPGAQFKCKLISRPGFPTCICELSSHQKLKIAVRVRDILHVDTTDYDRSDQGTAEILEVIHDAKDLKRLRKDGAIPAEDQMPEIQTKDHYTTKRDKRNDDRRPASKLTAEEEIEQRNNELSQPPAPNFGDDDESDAVPDDMKDHPAMQQDNEDEDEEESLASKKERGAHLTKAEKHACKLEEKARAAHQQLESNLANGVSGEALDDL